MCAKVWISAQKWINTSVSKRICRPTETTRVEIYWSSYRLINICSLYSMALQVGRHAHMEMSPHLWRSSLLVTNDSSDCSTSGVGFGVVWKSVLALTRQYKLFEIFQRKWGWISNEIFSLPLSGKCLMHPGCGFSSCLFISATLLSIYCSTN